MVSNDDSFVLASSGNYLEGHYKIAESAVSLEAVQADPSIPRLQLDMKYQPYFTG